MVYEFTSNGSNTYTYGHRLLYSEDYKYVLNAHGDVAALIDNNNEIHKKYNYDAFGNELNPSATDTNPFRYCAEYFDLETGQIYLRNRYYQPVTGRFTQLDPIRDGLNWYAYCFNNPIAFIDPFGLQKIDVIMFTIGKNSDFSDQAMWQKEQSEKNGNNAIIIPISNKNDFISYWNNLGYDEDGNTYEINDVYIFSHGNERSLIFVDGSAEEAISINGKNSAGEDIGDINDLLPKKMNNLYLLSCNGGHIGKYLYGSPDDASGNVASVFSKKVISGTVHGFDGSVSFGNPIDIKLRGENASYAPRLAIDQTSFYNINKKYSKLPFPRIPLGSIAYQNGGLKK